MVPSALELAQVRTPTSVVLFGVQFTVSQLFVPSPVCALHAEAPAGTLVSVGQVVVV